MKNLRWIFLDRDGVLNEDSADYIRSPDQVCLIPGTAEAVSRLNAMNLQLIIISNQSGIGRGYFSDDTARRIFEKILSTAESDGGKITDYYYCPHHPDADCACRKPKSGLFYQAAADYGIRFEHAIFIGDAISDYQAARKLNMPFFLVRTGKGRQTEHYLRDKNLSAPTADKLYDLLPKIEELL